MTTLFVVNPYCRNGNIDVDEIVQELAKLGPVDVFKIGGNKQVADRIAERRRSLKRIVIAGGDGTLNSALPAVFDSGLPLGVIPLGTANDFARAIGMPDDPVEAARAITASCTCRVDVSVVNGHFFLNAAGLGLGPDLTKEMDRDKKRRLGVFAYLESLIQVFYRRRRQYAVLIVDGVAKRMPFVQITIANGRHYGGGMTICDDAHVDDGLLHVLCVRPMTPWQLFLRGLQFNQGEVRDDEKLFYVTGKEVQVEVRRTCEVTADGELVTTTPLRCHVMDNALEVFVPREEAGVHDPKERLVVNDVVPHNQDQAAAVPA